MNITRGTLAIPNDPTPWVIAAPNDKKALCVLWLQGWNSTIAKHEPAIIRLAEETGVSFAILDYAGHGTHPTPIEKTTRQQQFGEVLAAFDALKAAGYERIIVAGTSFGGYLTALLSGERAPYAVILRAPAIYKDEEFSLAYPNRQGYAHEAYETFKRTVTPTSDLAALKAIQRFDGSVYVVEHEIDSVIPRNIPKAYFAAGKRANYLVIPATDHAVARMHEPEKHYAYIEQAIASIVRLVQAEARLV